MKRNKIFLLYPYYWPHYKAGGPVQSLINLARYFKDEADFYILSLDRDIDGALPDEDIKLNCWTPGPSEERIFFVRTFSPLFILKIIYQIKPDIIFVNGIFNISTTIPGIVSGKLFRYRLMVSPRGMLQKGALDVKPLKKRIFLNFFKWSGLYRNIVWHATDKQESDDIKKLFGLKANVMQASNIPRKPLDDLPLILKKEGQLRLVYFSLITRKKSLDVLLKALQLIEVPVELDIYGTVIDEEYWKSCHQLIQRNKTHKIRYNGPVNAAAVQSTLQKYHCFVLPTKGENFGHAIYESLSVGLPVILSPNTPWSDVGKNRAGLIVYSDNEREWANAIGRFIEMSQLEFTDFSHNAFKTAQMFFANTDFKSDYKELFQ